jgi:hypothetical protein
MAPAGLYAYSLQGVRSAQRLMVAILGLLLITSYFSAQGTQPQIVYAQFKPLVVRSDRSEPILFLAKVTGSPARVALERNGIESELRDDGTGGDAIPADGIYTLTLQASDVTHNLQPDDVFRPFIGFLNVYQQQTRIFRGNIFAEVITEQLPRGAVENRGADAQNTQYVYNVVDTAFVTGQSTDVTRVVRRFYEDFPDDFDFINIVYALSRFQNRSHSTVRNDVLGIGQRVFNAASAYGSSGKLQGISAFPISGFFDGAETGYQHELAHQWINFLQVPPLDSGIPHWPISSLASGIMGFSIPPSGEGGDYPCFLVPDPGGIRLVPRTGVPVFTDLDLYLMGLAPPEQVQEAIVFADQTAARTLPCTGVFTGATLKVRIADIINAVGRRIPDYTTAPNRFRVATIVVSKDELLNDDELAFYSFFAKRAEEQNETPYHSGFTKGIAKPFSISTGGRASLDAAITNKDIIPPIISGMPSKCTISPPNRQLVRVATITASDPESGIAPGSFNVTVSSNEPLVPYKQDIVITRNADGAFVVQLRAERSGQDKDRIYTLEATASDLAGNRTLSRATCVVPHDLGNTFAF